MADGSTPDARAIVKEVVGTSFALVVALADNRQLTYQSGFAEDEPDSVVNARIDRLMKIADRQKARYEIPEIKKELLQHRETLAQFEEDLARIETDHVRQQAMRRVELEALEAQRPEMREEAKKQQGAMLLEIRQRRMAEHDAGVAEHKRSGRTGSYVPSGARKANLDKFDADLEKAKNSFAQNLADWETAYDQALQTAAEQIDKAEQEKLQAEQQLKISIKRYVDAIAVREARLAECEAQLES